MGGMGGGMGGMGGMGGGMGMFNVPPEKVGQSRSPPSASNTARREPRAADPLRNQADGELHHQARRPRVVQMLGNGQINQRAAQAAAWHLNNGMSWQELAAKRLRFANGTSQPYFSPAEIQAGMQIAADGRQTRRGASRSRTPARATSAEREVAELTRRSVSWHRPTTRERPPLRARQFRPQPPQFLLILDPLGLPALRLFAELNLLVMELLFAGDQPGRLLLAFFLAAGGPTARTAASARPTFSCCWINWLRIASSSFLCSASSALAWRYCSASFVRMRPSDWVRAAGGAAPESCAQSSSVARRISSVSRCMRPNSARSCSNAARQWSTWSARRWTAWRFCSRSAIACRCSAAICSRIAADSSANVRCWLTVARGASGFRPGPRRAGPPPRRAVSAAPPASSAARRDSSSCSAVARNAFLLGGFRRGQPRQPLLHLLLPAQQSSCCLASSSPRAGQVGLALARTRGGRPAPPTPVGRSASSIRPRGGPIPSAGCEDARPVGRPGDESARLPARPPRAWRPAVAGRRGLRSRSLHLVGGVNPLRDAQSVLCRDNFSRRRCGLRDTGRFGLGHFCGR